MLYKDYRESLPILDFRCWSDCLKKKNNCMLDGSSISNVCTYVVKFTHWYRINLEYVESDIIWLEKKKICWIKKKMRDCRQKLYVTLILLQWQRSLFIYKNKYSNWAIRYWAKYAYPIIWYYKCLAWGEAIASYIIITKTEFNRQFDGIIHIPFHHHLIRSIKFERLKDIKYQSYVYFYHLKSSIKK